MKNLKQINNIFCIGIGGAGMSSLASILKKSGKNVSGSDIATSESVKKMISMGISIFFEHDGNNISKNTELVIFSPAIQKDNPERQKALQLGIAQMSYPQAVGELTREKTTIAVCGTHGKTTVTSMVSAIFLKAQKDPSVLVGSHISELENENHRLGKGDWLIIEACEYCRNFLNYNPSAIIINNIEADHLDYYKDNKDYISAYHEFIGKLQPGGLLVANFEDKNTAKLINLIKNQNTDINIVTFGESSGDFHKNDNHIFHGTSDLGALQLKIPGKHNIMNAMAAMALSISLGINAKDAITALNNYQGAARRFELVGKKGKTLIYNDYAHHPTEIKATLNAAREKFGVSAKILAVFQPHQYSRTYKLKNDFMTAFNHADTTIVSDIFPSRDSKNDIKKIDSKKLVEIIKRHSHKTIYGGNMKKTKIQTKKIMKDYDVVIVMGAGSIEQIIKYLLTKKDI